MSFRRSYGTGSYGGGGSSLLSGGYSSRGYSGYSSSISPASTNGTTTSYSQLLPSSYTAQPSNNYSNYNGSSYSGYSSSSPSYNSTSYTPSTSYINATSNLPSAGGSIASRYGRATSLKRSKSLPREQRERELSVQKYYNSSSSNSYSPSYSSSTYTPSYTGYTNSYLATRGLIKKARSKSSGSVTSNGDTATTNTLSASSSGYGSSTSTVSERPGDDGGSSKSVSRGSSAAPDGRGELDYKKLYEEQLAENTRLLDRLRECEREKAGLLATADVDRREKRALERRLSEMEEDLRVPDQLQQDNKRLKDENEALIRVISKLSR